MLLIHEWLDYYILPQCEMCNKFWNTKLGYYITKLENKKKICRKIGVQILIKPIKDLRQKII